MKVWLARTTLALGLYAPIAYAVVPCQAKDARLVWVQNLVSAVLSRSATNTETTALAARFNQGILTYSGYFEELQNSKERREGWVKQKFGQFLGRDADPGGLAYFANELQTRMPEKQVLTQILCSSPEYYNHKGGTPYAFANGLFRDLLNRGIDPPSAPFFSIPYDANLCANRVQLVLASIEYANLQVDQIFLAYLDRHADGGALAYFSPAFAGDSEGYRNISRVVALSEEAQERGSDGTTKTIQACLDGATPGSVVTLAPGRYYVDSPGLVVPSGLTLTTSDPAAPAAPPNKCGLSENQWCAELIATRTLVGAVLSTVAKATSIKLDHLIVNGNKEARRAQSGSNIYLTCADNCSVVESVSKFNVGGVSLGVADRPEFIPNHISVLNSTFYYNGWHSNRGVSDGVTVHAAQNSRFVGNTFIGNTDVSLIFGGCPNCVVQANTFLHDPAQPLAGSYAEIMISRWGSHHPDFTETTTGDFTNTDVSGNVISAGNQAGFGILLGTKPWPTIGWTDGNVSPGGTNCYVHDNTIADAQFGIAVTTATHFTLRRNVVTQSNPNQMSLLTCTLECSTPAPSPFYQRTIPYDISFPGLSSLVLDGTSYASFVWSNLQPNFPH